MTQKENIQQYQQELEALAPKTIADGEIIIGTLKGLNDQGKALVDFTCNSMNKPLVAISTVTLNQQQAGRQVALLFAEGNLEKPIIVGLIHSPLQEMLENFEVSSEQSQSPVSKTLTLKQSKDEKAATDIDNVLLDGKRVVLEGKEEVVLKCGDASITLTKEGKILIRGKYLLNRSSGVNRVMGGSVQIN